MCQKNRFWYTVFFLVLALLLIVPILTACGGNEKQATVAPSPTHLPTATLTPTAQEVWNTYSNANFVRSLGYEESGLWVGTDGGLLLVNRADHTYVKYTSSNSSLAGDWVRAIATDSAGNKWFGTDAGVSKLGTGTPEGPPTPQPLDIRHYP